MKNTLIILGNGPSLRGMDFSLFKNYDTFGLNTSYRVYDKMNFYPTYYGSFDYKINENCKLDFQDMIDNMEQIQKFFFIGICSKKQNLYDVKYINNNKFQKINFINTSNFNKISDNFDNFFNAGNSGANALQVGIMLGYKNIILLGCDANYQKPQNCHIQNGNIITLSQTENNINAWFDEYSIKGDINPTPKDKYILPCWESISKCIPDNVNVINCSKNSKIPYFKKEDFRIFHNRNKKAIVITTINSYNDTCIEDLLNSTTDFEIIVVGDLKTPHESYMNKNIIYLHPNDNNLSNLSKLLPYNHYSRKNIGYLYAIKNGFNYIYDTDDDNYPNENFLNFNVEYETIQKKNNFYCPNILSLYTNIHIWPRGYPLEYINNKHDIITHKSSEIDISNIGIYQSLSNGEPDVDAIFRLTNQNYNNNIKFVNNKSYIFEKGIYTQGNTQITCWIKKELFHLLYIPSTVSFRFSDILKMYVAQFCIWIYGYNFAYISPFVNQNRNEHDFMKDFNSEIEMYNNILKLFEIFKNIVLNKNQNDILIVYNELYKYNIVKKEELDILKEWLNETRIN
jgi:hypothetical protein